MERLEDPVNLLSKLHIPIGDSALRMCDQSESHCAPTDIDIGVMVDVLGIFGHPTDGVDPVEEFGERHRTDQRTVYTPPSVEIRCRGVHFVITEYSHLPTV